MNTQCSVHNCTNKHKGHGYCRNHLRKFYRYGDPLGKPPKPKGFIAHGYRLFSNGRNKTIKEHRFIMEQHLGRKLLPFPQETVHHINGNKLDNRIENLVVISQSEHSIITHRKAIIKDNKRLCLKCNIFKDFNEFHKDSDCKVGLATTCKICMIGINKIRYNKNYIHKRKSKH